MSVTRNIGVTQLAACRSEEKIGEGGWEGLLSQTQNRPAFIDAKYPSTLPT
jgi:hypothetical protein